MKSPTPEAECAELNMTEHESNKHNTIFENS